MRVFLTLNNLTLNAAINKLKWILEKPFIFNEQYKHVGGKVLKHPMLNTTGLVPDNCMILFNYDGSSANYWCEGDKFEFIDDESVVITETKSLLGKDRGKKKTITETYKSVVLTKKQKKDLEWKAKKNKEYADAYWDSVGRELSKEMDIDSGFEDCGNY